MKSLVVPNWMSINFVAILLNTIFRMPVAFLMFLQKGQVPFRSVSTPCIAPTQLA
jgi:hypothetical protein